MYWRPQGDFLIQCKRLISFDFLELFATHTHNYTHKSKIFYKTLLEWVGRRFLGRGEVRGWVTYYLNCWGIFEDKVACGYEKLCFWLIKFIRKIPFLCMHWIFWTHKKNPFSIRKYLILSLKNTSYFMIFSSMPFSCCFCADGIGCIFLWFEITYFNISQGRVENSMHYDVQFENEKSLNSIELYCGRDMKAVVCNKNHTHANIYLNDFVRLP